MVQSTKLNHYTNRQYRHNIGVLETASGIKVLLTSLAVLSGDNHHSPITTVTFTLHLITLRGTTFTFQFTIRKPLSAITHCMSYHESTFHGFGYSHIFHSTNVLCTLDLDEVNYYRQIFVFFCVYYHFHLLLPTPSLYLPIKYLLIYGDW